mgnify:FL=1
MNANKLSIEDLRSQLLSLLGTLQANREKVPLDILKTKYKKGYDDLCQKLRSCASEYAGRLTLSGIRIHRDYLEDGVSHVEHLIKTSGILKQLSCDIYKAWDIEAFERHCSQFQIALLAEMDHFYWEYPGLYITKECLENPDTLPLLYSPVNHCVFVNDTWIPLEIYQKGSTTTIKNQAPDA